MLTYTITGDKIVISEQVRAHIEKRFKSFERFLHRDTGHEIFITVSKTTAKERQDSFCVEAAFKINTQDFFAEATAVDIMTAVDQAKAELMREVTKGKAKRITMLHRGARKIKNFLKNPRS